jgi:glycosyltransferase involved in cell wall biosynthesis
MVPYKRIDLIVEAFSSMPDKMLVVIGDGPDFEKIKRKSASNVHLLGHHDSVSLLSYLQSAKAFVFAAEEDFGIAPLEAQACGTPVIAYAKGGALETIVALSGNTSVEDRPTGVFFYEQSSKSICEAVAIFEENQDKFMPDACRENATRFSAENFRLAFKSFVQDCIEAKSGH